MTGSATVLMFYGENRGHAAEAAAWYVEVLPEASVATSTALPGSSADAPLDRVEFRIATSRFVTFDSDRDHAFAPTPAVSVWLDLDSQASLREIAERLVDGGRFLMPVDAYGFSALFAWVEDRYGFSWQLNAAT